MHTKRIVELSFLALFALGVGISLVIHQSYDQWLSQLVQASGSKVAGGPLVLNDLKWQAAEQTLSLSGGQWFEQARASEAWLSLPAARWPVAADAWQGAQFHSERFVLAHLQVHLRQEGLSSNLNRLMKQVESVQITPEKLSRGKEPLLFTVDQVVFSDLQVEFTTLKHGVLRWHIEELTLTPTPRNQPFDVLLQQVTRALLAELKTQTTQQLLTLTEASQPSGDSPPSNEQ